LVTIFVTGVGFAPGDDDAELAEEVDEAPALPRRMSPP
jgi:hypothetical protein